jgi:peptidoglycan/LPS O-acetylase OafA/YrhL
MVGHRCVSDSPGLPGRPSSTWGYLPALDGLRAIAIAAVVATHAGFSRLLGAAQGVTVFFVISGFLITSLLVREHESTGRIGLIAFYRRRFARLMPAFVLAIVTTSVYLLATGHPWSGFWQGPVLSSFYVINVAGALGALTPLAHTYFVHNWSLAVEEQFYLVWPILLVGWLRRAWGRGALMAVCAGVIIASHVIRLSLVQSPDAGFERLNYATETRIDAIMIGSLLALVIGGVRAFCVRRSALLVGAATAVLALVLVQGAVVRLDPGGYLMVSGASAIVVATLVAAPTCRAARALSIRPLRWLGRLSYTVYLWNVLLLQVYLSVRHEYPSESPWGLAWLAATLLAAQLSYSCIEVPLRQRLRGRHRAEQDSTAPVSHDPVSHEPVSRQPVVAA